MKSVNTSDFNLKVDSQHFLCEILSEHLSNARSPTKAVLEKEGGNLTFTS